MDPAPMDTPVVCAVCRVAPDSSQPTLTWCGRCRAVSYCGRQCQTMDWPTHKVGCLPVDKVIDALHAKLMFSVASFAKKFDVGAVCVSFAATYADYAAGSPFSFAEIGTVGPSTLERVGSAVDCGQLPGVVLVTYVFTDARFGREVDTLGKKIGGDDVQCSNPWTLLVES